MLKNIETDLGKIQKLAKQNEKENWEFRSFLKGYYSSKKIDEIVHGLFQEVSSKIDCTKCGNCCKVMKPVLTPKDIENFSGGFRIPVAQFKKEHLTEHKDEEGVTFKTLPCPLLKDMLCAQYSYRPDACKSFPHLHKKDFVFRLMQIVENYSICPIVFNVYENLKDELLAH